MKKVNFKSVYIYIYVSCIKCHLKKAIINSNKILDLSPMYGRGTFHPTTTHEGPEGK